MSGTGAPESANESLNVELRERKLLASAAGWMVLSHAEMRKGMEERVAAGGGVFGGLGWFFLVIYLFLKEIPTSALDLLS